MKKMKAGLATLALAAAAGSAQADVVCWTDWTTAGTSQVSGSLTGCGDVGVTLSGAYSFAQTGTGTNYWNPNAPYLSSVVSNAPPSAEMVALGSAGTITINFSEAVVDPLIALVSWNGNTVDFNTPIQVLSTGTGFWGTGTLILNAAGDGFVGSGELHGVIRLPGTFTSISFTHTNEFWHGLTIGVVGLATPDNGAKVPEPGTAALLGIALLGLVGGLRRRRQ